MSTHLAQHLSLPRTLIRIHKAVFDDHRLAIDGRKLLRLPTVLSYILDCLFLSSGAVGVGGWDSQDMAAEKLFRMREIGEECAGLAIAGGEKTLSCRDEEDLCAACVSSCSVLCAAPSRNTKNGLDGIC